ncbi:MAG: TonB-dependent receptor [Steroidobacteraceae bacterium]
MLDKRFGADRLAIAAAGVLSLTISATVQAQSAPQSAPEGSSSAAELQEVVVTGIRKSLESATNAKREAVTFGDSIFAEDIGKLPATNLAETLNRIPGVQLNRDIDGEGVQVAIRGLGPSFSKVLLNGTQIGVASDGGTNGGSTNREVDLDFFPSELFTRLDVEKSPSASTLEGGIAGTVNLHSARPFDNPGQHLTVIGQGQYTDTNNTLNPRGAVIASKTWDQFGALVGVSTVHAKTRIDGFESVGWTDGNVACPVCDAAHGDTGNGFSYAGPTYPRNVGFGLVPGAPVDLAATSGLPLATLSKAMIPRLGRDSYTDGTRSRTSALISLEYRPSDELHLALDGMYARSVRDYTRLNMNWYVRNSGPGTSPTSTGGMVPIDLTVDSNNVVTSGTFANSSFFLENDVFNQTTNYWNVNPNLRWEPRAGVKVDAQLNYGHSTFFREQPQFDFQTPAQSGVAVSYLDNGGQQPVITPNVDLDNPGLGWNWYRVNVSNVRRTTTTKGAHVDLTLGEETNLRTGVAYDEAARTIRAFDNSAAFQTSVCGATCNGLSGSVPNSQAAQYLQPLHITNFGHLSSDPFGHTSFIQPNLAALEAATNYAFYRDTAPQSRGPVTGGPTGDILERTVGAYIEANSHTQLLDRELHLNVGVRYFHTDQKVTSPIQVASGLIDQTFTKGYEDFLPSFNTAWDVMQNLKLRASASRSITRADAGQLLPGTTFSDPSAQVAGAGNPDLKPFTSNNIDIGGEFYTGGLGYVGVALFRKNVDGFTLNQQSTVPFSSLGIAFSNLTTTQQQAILGRPGGVDAATVTITKPVNLQNLVLKGIELTWQQPLDFVLRGLGFSANGTHISQSSGSGLVAPGIAPYTYNLQGYYENYGVSLSVNYVWADKFVALNPPQNNLPVGLIADKRGQLDLSLGYQLPFMTNALRVTLDALNLTNEPLRTVFGYENAPYSVYYPGREVLLGVRATF